MKSIINVIVGSSMISTIVFGIFCVISLLHFLGHINGNGTCFDCSGTDEDAKNDTILMAKIFGISAVVLIVSCITACSKNKTVKA